MTKLSRHLVEINDIKLVFGLVDLISL